MEHNKIRKITYKGETYISKSTDNIFELIKEINIYNNLDYPNIPKIKHILTNSNNTFEFLFDVYDRDLSNYIIKPLKFKMFLTEMLLTLHYIHSKGIFHSDVKPTNILIKNDKYSLIDYDISEFYGFPQSNFPYYGTPGFSVKDIKNNSDFNLDIFSLGVTSIYILTGDINYNKTKIEDLIGKDGANLLEDMLGLNGKYISSTEALNNPYIDIIVDTYENIALKDNQKLKAQININFKNTKLTSEVYDIVINWIIKVCLEFSFYRIQIILSTNQLLRNILNLDKNISSKNMQLYSICSLLIVQYIFASSLSMNIEDASNITGNTYTTKEIEVTISNIMNKVNWKVDMIPYRLYLDFYMKKYFISDPNKYMIGMKMSEVILLDLLFHDNEIKETLYELSYYIIDIVIYYMFKKNMKDLYLYNKTIKHFEFFSTFTEFDKSNTLDILVKYLKI